MRKRELLEESWAGGRGAGRGGRGGGAGRNRGGSAQMRNRLKVSPQDRGLVRGRPKRGGGANADNCLGGFGGWVRVGEASAMFEQVRRTCSLLPTK